MPSSIGPVLDNNHELKKVYRVISVNNLGVLYVITTDPSISGFESLAGKTVCAHGEGGTPEYTIEALLKKTGCEGAHASRYLALELLKHIPESIYKPFGREPPTSLAHCYTVFRVGELCAWSGALSKGELYGRDTDGKNRFRKTSESAAAQSCGGRVFGRRLQHADDARICRRRLGRNG